MDKRRRVYRTWDGVAGTIIKKEWYPGLDDSRDRYTVCWDDMTTSVVKASEIRPLLKEDHR